MCDSVNFEVLNKLFEFTITLVATISDMVTEVSKTVRES